MKRKPIYTTLTVVVIFVIYSIILFLLKAEKSSAFWVAYIFTLIAIILAEGMSAWLTAGGKKNVTFLQLPAHIYCGIFSVVELVVGFILMLIVTSVKVVVVIEAVLYAVFLVLQLTMLHGKELIEDMETELAQSTSFISELRLESENLYVNAKGTASEKKLKEVAEAIRYSDPVSNVKLQQIERELAEAFWVLKKVGNGEPEQITEAADKVLCILGERNRSCKALK